MSDTKMPEDGLRETGPSHSGTESAWSVQVRCPGHLPPVIIGEHAYDSQWRDLPIVVNVPYGIPMGSAFDIAPQMGLMTYAAAQALRWKFLADMTASCKDYRFETRLVRHEVRYSIATKPVSACDHTDHLGLIRADLGKEQAR